MTQRVRNKSDKMAEQFKLKINKTSIEDFHCRLILRMITKGSLQVYTRIMVAHHAHITL